jgi:sporulation protein YlmC with PRC-barrel domain
MRLSTLLERPVIDQHGRALGQVHDVHLVQDGPLLPSGFAAYRLHGLVAGHGSFGTRLGYSGRRGYDDARFTRGPLPIKALVRWLHRNAIYIPWGDVTGIEDDRIVVHSPDDGFKGAG